MEQDTGKRIAKNTILLYVRMLITMGVSLYTSRVILDVLGVDEFGIYQAVAGVVGMFAFLNGALATGTSRFITFALGENDKLKLKRIFDVSLSLHFFISIVFVVLSETVGLYFLFEKMVLPPDRMDIIIWVYQLTILASVVSILQVPYTADIISHEHMNVYAYMSILEVVLKLLIVYLLVIGNVDKLLLYSILLLFTQIAIFIVYYTYTKKQFEEARGFSISIKNDISLYKEVGAFSGWSLLSVTSSMLANQGVVVLLNMFFSPALVAARAISNQINNVVNQFVQNFRTAVNPQIVKSYAQKELGHSSSLVLISTKVSFYLVLLIGMPLLMNADYLLGLWLVEVPEYSIIFLQLIIIQTFIQTIDNSLYYGLYACGKIKQNAIVSPIIALLGFPICYVLFKLGFSPVSMSWCYIGVYSIIGFIVKPFLLNRYAGYSYTTMIKVLFQCVTILVPCLALFFSLDSFVKSKMAPFMYLLLSCLLCFIIIVTCVYTWGLEKNIRDKIVRAILNKINK